MLLLHHRVTTEHLTAGMDSHPASPEEYFHRMRRQPEIYFFSNEIIGDGLLVQSVADQIVIAYFQVR